MDHLERSGKLAVVIDTHLGDYEGGMIRAHCTIADRY
jgi:hypothetical protein